MLTLKPYKREVRAHYDLCDEFFALFLDPTRTYSCAYFKSGGTTLEDAQRAKIDLSLDKCDLRPGMRLLDIGCGWGATALRAASTRLVSVVGLTLSKNQFRHANRLAAAHDDVEFRLQAWEQFDEPVDRIVSIGALEHFRVERYPQFFARCRKVLPSDGRMMLHSIVHGKPHEVDFGPNEFDEEFLDYARFIRKHIFPGGQVPARETVVEHAGREGFECIRLHSLREHYARTLDCWSSNLEAQRARAVELTSIEIYDRYMRYLTESAHYFRTGHCDVVQFSFRRAS